MSKLIHIQLLRALAALAVAFLHAQHDAAALAVRIGQSFASLEHYPWMAGVDVFFVISGFIMVYASRSFFGKRGVQSIFLARRIARIVPLYWTFTTLYLVIALIAPALLNNELLVPWQILASYLFIPFARPDGVAQPLYSLGWTLNYEMFFYGLFALVLVFPRRWALALLVAILAGLVFVGRIFALQQPMGFWTDPIILEFAFGLGLGWLRAEGFTLNRLSRWGLALGGLAILSMNFIGLTGNWSEMRPLAWGLPAACLVAAAALGPERPLAMNALTRFGVLAGDASYAIYLVHPFVIRGMGAIMQRLGADAILGLWGFIALSLLATLLAGVVVHRWFELPAMQILRARIEPVKPSVSSKP